MSSYSEQLARLKRELAVISEKKSKPFNKNQKAVIDFVNGKYNRATFSIKGMEIILRKGNENYGFMHILLKHYKQDDLKAMDIINIADAIKRGITLSEEGVSNGGNIVILHRKSEDDIRVVLSPDKNETENTLVITMYRKL